MEKMEEIGFGNAGGNWVETRSSYRGDGVTAELDTEEKPLYLNFLNATIRTPTLLLFDSKTCKWDTEM